MDIEKFRARAAIIRAIREFFWERGYLELDTPVLSPSLIPETCLEAFKTEEIFGGAKRELYLVPSPEIYMKKIIARHKVNVFQISKCFRNVESRGAFHNPEFTMLEYYTMNVSYNESAALTEELFAHLSGRAQELLSPPFTRMTMEEAFKSYAGFSLASAQEAQQLAEHARHLGIVESKTQPFDSWAWDDLYELILVHAVEPQLPRQKPVLLMDYPAKVPCLAKDVPRGHGEPLCKERWELYADGVELANCYSEETDPQKIKAYFEREGCEKNKTARVPHAVDDNYWKIFEAFGGSHKNDAPGFSGVALGVDRLIALMTGSRAIESVLPFPL